jgi:hypothetical protein
MRILFTVAFLLGVLIRKVSTEPCLTVGLLSRRAQPVI